MNQLPEALDIPKPREDFEWLRCPICNQKTRTKVYPQTALVYYPLYCSHCRTETIVDVIKLKMVRSKEPDV